MSDILNLECCPLCNKPKSQTSIHYKDDGSIYSNYIAFSCGLGYYKYTDGREHASPCAKGHELFLKIIKPTMLPIL